MDICPTCVSKHDSNRKNQVIFLMIPNRERMVLSCSKKFEKNYLKIALNVLENGYMSCQRFKT